MSRARYPDDVKQINHRPATLTLLDDGRRQEYEWSKLAALLINPHTNGWAGFIPSARYPKSDSLGPVDIVRHQTKRTHRIGKIAVDL